MIKLDYDDGKNTSRWWYNVFRGDIFFVELIPENPLHYVVIHSNWAGAHIRKEHAKIIE